MTLNESIKKSINTFHSFNIKNVEVLEAEIVKNSFSVLTDNSPWTVKVSDTTHPHHDIRIIADQTFEKIEYIYSGAHNIVRGRLGVSNGLVLVVTSYKYNDNDFPFEETYLQLGICILDSSKNVSQFFELRPSTLEEVQEKWDKNDIAVTNFKSALINYDFFT